MQHASMTMIVVYMICIGTLACNFFCPKEDIEVLKQFMKTKLTRNIKFILFTIEN
jgi:Pyruvate/2-oxoacid:ferredoxin oxidoreductase delta subunit